MKVEEIIQLLEAVSKNNIDQLSVTSDDGKEIVITNNDAKSVVVAPEAVVPVVPTAPVAPAQVAVAPAQVAAVPAPVAAVPTPAAPEEKGQLVKSPLVGTFYNAPSPDSPAYVKVGDTVKKGQILGIIEAMKLMNEIESDYDGIVTEILIKNEETVEFGQPLFRIG
ncbi:MAG: acetyl-CoA carboxylase biotin carboxyl carrier protein [Lachnoanaerobaculum sp.]|nr:MAG: acetyl-CoA carboxylase biotin carboxyl carrier protein [Lachnoanaerobaculum sp.]